MATALVRERRKQQPLKLPLPPQIRVPEFHAQPPVLLPLPVMRLESPEITVENLSDLEKLAVLGHGNGGTVYKVRHRRNSTVYALKVFRFSDDATGIGQQAAREAEILKRVDSPYIVRCHGFFGTGESDGVDLSFVMEYMESGSLHDMLCSRRRLPEKLISGVARRVLEGLKYLHSMRIVHRDIKPSNLLINGRGEVKIADFGVSHVVAGSIDAGDSYMGTCAYMSPERFDPDTWCGGRRYDGFAGDVWALGVAMLECHVGSFPLISLGEKPDWATLMCAICFGESPEMPETASSEFRSFVGRCLEKDWRKRGTVEELLGHPFVAKSC